MWFDDVRQWTLLKDYNEVKRNAEDREAWSRPGSSRILVDSPSKK